MCIHFEKLISCIGLLFFFGGGDFNLFVENFLHEVQCTIFMPELCHQFNVEKHIFRELNELGLVVY